MRNIYVLDSSVVIEAVKDGPLLPKISDICNDEPLTTTSICMHEVLAGAISAKERFVLEGIFSTMRILEHDVKSALESSSISQSLTKQGNKINTTDILIAGICKAHNAIIVTLDKDFAKIKEIKSRIIS